MHALRAFLCYMAVIVILVAFPGYIYTDIYNIYYIPYMYGCMNVWASYMVAYVAAAAA